MSDINWEERFNTHRELIKDRIMASEMGLLNALISIDGLFIGAAAVISAVSPKIPKLFFASIIACCSISILLVLWNYATIRRVFRDMGLAIHEAMTQESVFLAKLAELQKQVKASENAHSHNQKREYVCYFLLALTVFIFSHMLYAY